MLRPYSTHYARVLRIFRYVKGIIYNGLHFSSSFYFELRAHSNANWTSNPIDRRSIAG